VNKYYEQASQLGNDLIATIRRYGHEYDLDVSTVLGVLEVVKYDVITSALELAKELENEEEDENDDGESWKDDDDDE
jgi:hypothetical protein